jgi:hypothetical protein
MSDEVALAELLSAWQLEKAHRRDLPATVLCHGRPDSVAHPIEQVTYPITPMVTGG